MVITTYLRIVAIMLSVFPLVSLQLCGSVHHTTRPGSAFYLHVCVMLCRPVHWQDLLRTGILRRRHVLLQHWVCR